MKMKKAISLFLSVSLLFISVPPISNVPRVRADDSDIFGGNVQPNVTILLDNSGSMAFGVPSYSYDPNTTYPVRSMCRDLRDNCLTAAVYKGMGQHPDGYPRYFFYAGSIADVSDSQARQALSTTGYWVGAQGGSQVDLYLGNYLNYLYCTTCPGSEARLDTAKRVLGNFINNVQGVRFGVMTFNQSPPGGAMVSPIGTDKATMVSAINGIVPSGGTPLGGQLRDAGHYYNGNFEGYPSPIQYTCQPNFIILITDGMQDDTQSSNAVQVQAGVEFRQDHSNSLPGLQNVITHTIGFALEAGEDQQATSALQETAQNGGGQYRRADDAAQLERALQQAIRQIIAATFSFATPVVPTTSTTGSTKAFLAAFQSNPANTFWRGYLKAYQRGSDGLVPVDSNGVPCSAAGNGCLASALLWDAGEQLRLKSPADRTIKTVVSGSLTDFTTSNVSAALLGVSTTADRDKIVGFIRGVDTYDEDADGNATEDRAWKLGDIFHSTPVLVTPPFLASSDSSYIAFKQANASRTTVVIGGANDGMLHAFRESDGEELWAFIPPNLLSSLKNLTVSSNEHSFYVDGSPVAADIKIGSTWKTIVIFGERRGGTSYYALDITDPTNPQYLWSFTDTKMGETWSIPAVGKVKMADGTTKFVGFIGGGYNTPQNNASGKAVFAINLADGTKLWEYYNATGSSDDRQYMNFSIPGDASAIDLSNDGFIDKVYIGDVGGQLWKFDTSAAATLSSGLVNNWVGKRMFTAPLTGTNPPATGEYYPAQAIYGAPIPALDDLGNVWVYFGTGDRNHPNNNSTNRFYGIKDNVGMTNGSPLTESSLSNVTSADATASQGWYFTLASNEKVLAAADVFNRVVFFSTFTPTSVVACDTGGGTAKLYAVQMLTGYGAIDFATGYALTSTSSSQARSTTIGTGIPSSPIMVVTDTGTTVTTNVTSLTTSNQFPSNPGPAPSNMKRILYWREVF
jgi:type IV pilus assembly protein PilY1